MEHLTEQKIKERQKKAYENRDLIVPGDRIILNCHKADEKNITLKFPGGMLTTNQPDEGKFKSGDPVRLTCTAVITKSNGYGPFVDYQFEIQKTGTIVTINGPDAQSFFRRRKATTSVQNRDIPVLAGVISSMQAISQTEQRIAQMRDVIAHITQTITGMPGGGNARGMDDLFAELSELEDTLTQEGKYYLHKVKAAQAILDGIDNPNMRTFVMMKYVILLPDAEIRSNLNMTRRSFERAAQCIEAAADMKSAVWQERYTKKSG